VINRDLILSMTRDDIISIISRMTLEDLEDTQKHCNVYFRFLEALREIPNSVPDLIQQEPESTITNQVEMGSTVDAPVKAYTFARKLRGGYVAELEAFVPEKDVRKLGIEDGDRLFLVNFTEIEDKKFYTWRLAQRQSHDVSHHSIGDRHEFKYCMIEKDLGRLLVKKQMTDEGELNLKLDDAPHMFLLREEDIADFRLGEGDIVDIACTLSKPDFGKVVWKHKTVETIGRTKLAVNQIIIKPHRKEEKEKEKSQSTPKFQDADNVLYGKRILIVGAQSKWSQFIDMFKSFGAQCVCVTGDEKRPTLEASVRKSNAVVLLMDTIGHHARWTVAKYCKEYQIPFHEVIHFGLATVVRGAIEALSFQTSHVANE